MDWFLFVPVGSLRFFTGALVVAAAAVNAQLETQLPCNETTENYLEIDFNVTDEYFRTFVMDWDAPTSSGNDVAWGLRGASYRPNPRTALGEYYHNRFESASDVVPFSLCIPKDYCAVISVRNLDPNSQFKIRLDGVDVLPGPSYGQSEKQHLFSTTEIGSCVPQCEQDTEALFDLEAFAGFHHTRFDWGLHDVGSGEKLATCSPPYPASDYNSLCLSDSATDFFRKCLPRDGCYRFVAGSVHRIEDVPWKPPAVFSASFDGQPVVEFEDFHFDSAEFGESCSPPASARLTCTDDESVVQVQLYRFGTDEDSLPDVIWSLLDGSSASTLKNGTFSAKETGVIEFVEECIPKDSASCITFAPSVPDDFRVAWDDCVYNVSYGFNFPYRVTVDDVVVAEYEFTFEAFDDGEPRQYPPTPLNDSCRTRTKLSVGPIIGIVVGSMLILVLTALVFANRKRIAH
jgi:hypothetical protein